MDNIVNKAKKPLNIILFELGILLIPYDAMHVMPSTYAPITVYPFLLSLFVSVMSKQCKIQINKLGKNILLTFFYMVAISLITVARYLDTYKFFFQFCLTFSIGLISYFSVVNAQVYYRLRYTQEEFFQKIVDLICKAYYIPIIVGFLEILAIIGILPYSVKLLLNQIFGGWQNRLCMTNHEASWASMHMLILISSSFAMFRWEKKRKYLVELFCGVFFFLVIASAQGMLSLALAAFIYVALSNLYNNNIRNFLKTSISVAAILAIFGYGFYRVLLLNPSSYFASRILYFTSLSNLLTTDSSTFIRIGYLILHLLIFKDHVIFGIGGGSFNYMFADYAIKYFPKSTYLAEVAAHINMEDASTTVSTYFSVLSEFGIIGTVLFTRFLIGSIQNIKYLKLKDPVGIMIFFSVCLALPIQFGSWSYVPWWFALALLAGIRKR